MTDSDLPVEVTGTVKLRSGQTVEFRITKEYGYSQWGNREEILWKSLPLIEALNQTAAEHLVEEWGEMNCADCGESFNASEGGKAWNTQAGGPLCVHCEDKWSE